MKLLELFEGFEETDTAVREASIETGIDIVEYIKKNCSEWLAQSSGRPALHGTRKIKTGAKFEFIEYFSSTIEERPPKDTKIEIHNAINDSFTKQGLIANRSNSIFITGNISQAIAYGRSFVVIPNNGWNITWNPDVKDFHLYISGHTNEYLLPTEALEHQVKFLQKKHEQEKSIFRQPNLKSELYRAYDKNLTQYYDINQQEFDNLVSKYKDNELERALQSGVEIMLNAPTGFTMIDAQIYKILVEPVLNNEQVEIYDTDILSRVDLMTFVEETNAL